jgi:hypothetical protein
MWMAGTSAESAGIRRIPTMQRIPAAARNVRSWQTPEWPAKKGKIVPNRLMGARFFSEREWALKLRCELS